MRQLYTPKRAANIMMTHVKHIFKPHFSSTQPVINLWYVTYIIFNWFECVWEAEAHFSFMYIFIKYADFNNAIYGSGAVEYVQWYTFEERSKPLWKMRFRTFGTDIKMLYYRFDCFKIFLIINQLIQWDWCGIDIRNIFYERPSRRPVIKGNPYIYGDWRTRIAVEE